MTLNCRHEAVEDYKGFYVPRSISLSRGCNEGVVYSLALLEDEIDARFHKPSEGKSPWIANDVPSLSEIEAFWQPLTDQDMLHDMEDIFQAVERHALDHYAPDLTDEQKLKAVRREDFSPERLGYLDRFCRILGQGHKEAENWIENHVIFAAYNPHNYLITHDLLKDMTLDNCQYFSWRDTVTRGGSYFRENRLICEMDWKSDAEDVAYCVNDVLEAIFPDRRLCISLHQDEKNYLTEYWLDRASEKLRKLKLYIVFLDNIGDSYIFTLADKPTAAKLVSLGKKLGLEAAILPPGGESRQSWLRRLLS